MQCILFPPTLQSIFFLNGNITNSSVYQISHINHFQQFETLVRLVITLIQRGLLKNSTISRTVLSTLTTLVSFNEEFSAQMTF